MPQPSPWSPSIKLGPPTNVELTEQAGLAAFIDVETTGFSSAHGRGGADLRSTCLLFNRETGEIIDLDIDSYCGLREPWVQMTRRQVRSMASQPEWWRVSAWSRCGSRRSSLGLSSHSLTTPRSTEALSFGFSLNQGSATGSAPCVTWTGIWRDAKAAASGTCSEGSGSRTLQRIERVRTTRPAL